MIDSAGYGPFEITTSIQIVSPEGVQAALAPKAGSAIVINTAGTVVLRNLFINSQGASTGVQVSNSGTVYIEGCVISGFAFDGISRA